MRKLGNLWKSLALFAALVCLATVSYGQGSVYQNQVLGPTGAPKGGATITVCNNAGNSLATCPGPNNANLAQIFSDQALTLPLVNPLTADGLGNFQFFAAAGIYYYTVTGAGTTTPGPDIAILYCIPNGSCGLGSQFPWTQLTPTATPVLTVGNGNVNYGMPIGSNITSVTVSGTPHNGDYLGFAVQEQPPGGFTISTGVFPANFIFPPGFTFNTSANAQTWMAWTYDGPFGTWQPTAVWGGGSGGSSFYQFLQQAGTQKTQRPNLNFLSPFVITDNPGNSSSDVSIPLNYQTLQNNAVSLPVEPKVNLVPPLTAVDNPANTRTDINCPTYVGVGGSHSSGCMIDPGASGAATDYPGRDAQWHTSVSAATVKPDPTSSIIYVASICNGGGACSDANDGLSWGTAKLTPYAALLALPGGSASPPQAGHGIVKVSSDPVNGIAFGGPVGGGLGGWWMFGSGDPGYAGGVTGWMRAPANGLSVTLECAAPTNVPVHDWGGTCLEFWGGHADNVHPAIWWSDFTGQATLRGFNFNFESNPIKIGIDSSGSRSAGGTSSVWLDKIGVNMGACYSGIGAGPGIDIAANSFWIKISDSSYTGCVTQDYTATAVRASNVVTLTLNQSGTGDIVAGASNYIIVRNMTDPTFNGAFVIASASGTSVTYAQNGPNASTSGGQVFPYGAAAIGINGGQGPGFIYVENTAVNDGGIWGQGGSNGVGLSANRIIYEGDFSHPDMSVVELLPTTKNFDTTVYINDVQFADNTVPICGVESTGTGNISAQNTTTCGSMIAPYGEFPSTTVASPLRQGTLGLDNGVYAGPSNAGRRMFSPYAVRFPNIIGINSTWNLNGMTPTTGQTAPDGTTGAELVTNSTGSSQALVFGGTSSHTPAVGDTYVYGAWLKSTVSGTAPPPLQFTLNFGGVGVGDYCQSSYLSMNGSASAGSSDSTGSIAGDGEWKWFSGICKIIVSPSSGFQILQVTVPNTGTVLAYGPTLALVPTGTLSDNENYELLTSLQAYPVSASAGDVSMLPGQHLRSDALALNPITAPTGSAGNLMLYMDSTANWASFKNNNNTPYIIPGFTGTWTAGQCATATATTNVFNLGPCGSGSGTITASQQFNLAYYSGAGSSSTINGATGPTSFAEPYFWITIPSGGVATAPQAALPGVPGRTTASATDTILFSDRASRVEYTDGAAVTVTLPAAGSAGFSNNMVFQAKSRGNTSVVTFNQGAGNCNGGGAGTCVLKQGQVGTFKTIDNTNWFMDAHEPPITCGTNLVCTRSDYGLTLSSTAGGGTLTATGASLPNGQLIVGNVYPDTKPADLSGDCSTSGTTVTTCTRLNGGAFSGANGDLVSFGAANIPADSGVVAANAVTAGSNFTTGDLVQAAGNNKTTSDSGVIAANVVTNSTGNAAAANQIIVSGGANKTAKAIDFPDVHVIPSANCNNTSAGAGWSIGSGGAVLCRAGTNNKGGYIQITDTAATFATFQIHIPKDWDTATNPYIAFDISSTDATSGHTIIPSIQVACYKGDGSTTDDVTAQVAHSLSTITLNTTTNQFWSTSNVQLNSTDMTGCSGGSLMQITVGRATDTATNAQFYSATMTFPRLLVVQAN